MTIIKPPRTQCGAAFYGHYMLVDLCVSCGIGKWQYKKCAALKGGTFL